MSDTMRVEYYGATMDYVSKADVSETPPHIGQDKYSGLPLEIAWSETLELWVRIPNPDIDLTEEQARHVLLYGYPLPTLDETYKAPVRRFQSPRTSRAQRKAQKHV